MKKIPLWPILFTISAILFIVIQVIATFGELKPNITWVLMALCFASLFSGLWALAKAIKRTHPTPARIMQSIVMIMCGGAVCVWLLHVFGVMSAEWHVTGF